MKKKSFVSVVAVMILCVVALVACGQAKKTDPTFTVPSDLSVAYGSTLGDISLPEGFSWQDKSTTSVGAVGKHTFLATYTPSDTRAYNVVKDVEISVTVVKADYNMSGVTFDGAEYTFDGITARSLAIGGTLPQGVTVAYENNGQTNVGSYEVVARFTGDDNHNAIPEKRATLTILKADIQGLGFESLTVPSYDGAPHSIAVTGTDDTMTVRYSAETTQINAGVYPITATISKENYNDVVLNATLTINKATFASFVFSDDSVVYNGQVQNLEVNGAFPRAITVRYTGNGNVNAGTYTVVAHFDTGNNYNAIEDKTATLTILPASLSDVSVEQSARAVYNGQAQRVTVNENATAVGNDEVTFTYAKEGSEEYSSALPEYTNAGSYLVKYKAVAANHVPSEGTFSVTIDKAPLTVTADDKEIEIGSDAPDYTAIITGFAGEETEDVLDGELLFACAYEKEAIGGEYDVVPSGLTADNYDITFVPGTLTVR